MKQEASLPIVWLYTRFYSTGVGLILGYKDERDKISPNSRSSIPGADEAAEKPIFQVVWVYACVSASYRDHLLKNRVKLFVLMLSHLEWL